MKPVSPIIIHQTHYQKSDWSRAFNQFTIACELDMISAISPADNNLLCLLHWDVFLAILEAFILKIFGPC